MKNFTEVNLEELSSSSSDAIALIKQTINNCKNSNTGCVMFIHGYGSSGKGGIIREKARQWLNAQVRNGNIKTVINGEDFDIFNFKALELKNKYKELEKLLRVTNHGVTVVEI